MSESTPASAGPRVSDEELARLIETAGPVHDWQVGNGGIGWMIGRLSLDLAAANARIAVLEAAVEAIITEYQDYCADKHMDTSESMYAMYELALATLATASPEPGAAHE